MASILSSRPYAAGSCQIQNQNCQWTADQSFDMTMKEHTGGGILIFGSAMIKCCHARQADTLGPWTTPLTGLCVLQRMSPVLPLCSNASSMSRHQSLIGPDAGACVCQGSPRRLPCQSPSAVLQKIAIAVGPLRPVHHARRSRHHQTYCTDPQLSRAAPGSHLAGTLQARPDARSCHCGRSSCACKSIVKLKRTNVITSDGIHLLVLPKSSNSGSVSAEATSFSSLHAAQQVLWHENRGGQTWCASQGQQVASSCGAGRCTELRALHRHHCAMHAETAVGHAGSGERLSGCIAEL